MMKTLTNVNQLTAADHKSLSYGLHAMYELAENLRSKLDSVNEAIGLLIGYTNEQARLNCDAAPRDQPMALRELAEPTVGGHLPPALAVKEPAKPKRGPRKPSPGKSNRSDIRAQLIAGVNCCGETFTVAEVAAACKMEGAKADQSKRLTYAAKIGLLAVMVKGRPFAPAIYTRGPEFPKDQPAPAAMKTVNPREPGPVRMRTKSGQEMAIERLFSDLAGSYSAAEIIERIGKIHPHLVATQPKISDLRVRLIDMAAGNKIQRSGIGPDARYHANTAGSTKLGDA